MTPIHPFEPLPSNGNPPTPSPPASAQTTRTHGPSVGSRATMARAGKLAAASNKPSGRTTSSPQEASPPQAPGKQARYRLLVVDDHTAVRMGLRWLLKDAPQFEIVGECGSGDDVLPMCEQSHPDIVILDIRMPGLDAYHVIETIHARFNPAPKILIYSATGHRQSILDFLRLGVAGFVLKSDLMTPFLEALIQISRGQTYFDPVVQPYVEEFQQERLYKSDRLSPREKEILRRVALSETTKEIAHNLGLSMNTVEVHRLNIMRKTRCKNLAALTRCAMEMGLV